MACWPAAACCPLCPRSGSQTAAACGVVFLDDVTGQSAALGYDEALLLSPGTHLPAPFPADRRSGAGSGPRWRRRPRVINEGSKPTAEIGSVTAVEVYLVGPAVHFEADGLIGRAAGEIIFQKY
jgi:hypothetical protein